MSDYDDDPRLPTHSQQQGGWREPRRNHELFDGKGGSRGPDRQERSDGVALGGDQWAQGGNRYSPGKGAAALVDSIVHELMCSIFPCETF